MERWHPLPAESVVDYLNSIGLRPPDLLRRVWRVGGRNRTYAVAEAPGEDPAFFLKQFGSDDYDELSFASERHWSGFEGVPSPELLHADEAWRVVVLRNSGRSLLGLLRNQSGVDARVVEGLLDALQVVHAQVSDVRPTLPPVVTWFSSDAKQRRPQGLANAQLRLLAAVSDDPGLRRAVARVRGLWDERPTSLIHNDLQLGHVIVDSTAFSDGGSARIVFVDWEFARSGPAQWDYAGIVQSLLSEVVLKQVPWSDDVALLVRTLYRVGAHDNAPFADLVALRLLQTAIELETAAGQISTLSAPICQLAVSLAKRPEHLDMLVGAA